MDVKLKIQGVYKLSECFAKLDNRCILCNEIVRTTIWSTSQEDHDVQIYVGTRVERPQIPGTIEHTRSVRKPFPSNTDLRFSREMAVATIGQFQMICSLYVIDTNFMILRHFLLMLWRKRNPPIIYTHPVYPQLVTVTWIRLINSLAQNIIFSYVKFSNSQFKSTPFILVAPNWLTI
jgi:hypothetical protein